MQKKKVGAIARAAHALASKVRNHSWKGSVQGAVATWSAISVRYLLTF